MSNQKRTVIGALLIIVSTLCAAFILSALTQSLGWLDATSNSRYTLSDGTEKILAKVQRPLTATLYFSKTTVNKIGTDQLQPYNRAYYYARDLLVAYERMAGGKLTVVEKDPQPFTDTAEEAVELGVQQYEIPNTGGLLFFFGLVVAADTGAKEVIPVINAREEGLLEYKITKMIERVSRPSKKKIGIVGGIDIAGENLSPEMMELRRHQGMTGGQAWNIVEWLKLDYDVEKIEPTATSIPAGLDFLMVVHPKNFSDKLLYAIDQFVLGGGRLVAFVDPFCEVDQPPNNPRNPYAAFSHPRESHLNRLTAAWGVKMTTGKIVGDQQIAFIQRGQPMLQYNLFGADGGCISATHAVTEPLAAEKRSRLLLGHCGQLEKVADAKVTFEPLLQTTASGGVRQFSGMDYMTGRQDPSRLWRPADGDNAVGFEPAGKPVVTAAVVTGTFQSAFPDGLPGGTNGDDSEVDGADPTKKPSDKKDGEAKDGEKKKEGPKHLKVAEKENSIVLIADVDLISDQFVTPTRSFFASPFANKALLLNSLDFLAGSKDLMSIRSRSPSQREFDLIQEREREAAQRTQDTVNAINAEIERFQKTINELNSQATGENVGKLQGEALRQQREAQTKIAAKRRELREVQREAREDVEALKWRAQAFNVAGMPLLVALIGLVLWIVGFKKRSQQMREDMS